MSPNNIFSQTILLIVGIPTLNYFNADGFKKYILGEAKYIFTKYLIQVVILVFHTLIFFIFLIYFFSYMYVLQSNYVIGMLPSKTQ